MTTGIVYVLTNEAMPGLVLIGRTDGDLEERLTDLTAAAGVPLPFECHFAAAVEDAVRVERTLGQLFADHRLNPRRGFFRVDPERVVLALSLARYQEVTPAAAFVEKAEQDALDRAKSRRPQVRLEAIGIGPGDRLSFSRDESVQATVTADGRVELGGPPVTLTAAAQQVLERLGYSPAVVRGADYWMFDGELLDDRRRRLESEQFDQPAAG